MEKKNQHLVQVRCENTGNIEDLTCTMTHGVTLLWGLVNERIPINHSCGGNGTCGTCRIVIVNQGQKAPPRNDIENEIAAERGFREDERLACQLEVRSDLVIKIPGP